MKKLFFIFAMLTALSSQAWELDPINCNGINSKNGLQYKLEAKPYQYIGTYVNIVGVNGTYSVDF